MLLERLLPHSPAFFSFFCFELTVARVADQARHSTLAHFRTFAFLTYTLRTTGGFPFVLIRSKFVLSSISISPPPDLLRHLILLAFSLSLSLILIPSLHAVIKLKFCIPIPITPFSSLCNRAKNLCELQKGKGGGPFVHSFFLYSCFAFPCKIYSYLSLPLIFDFLFSISFPPFVFLAILPYVRMITHTVQYSAQLFCI